MFSHIMIGTNDLARAKTFYDAVLGTLGVPPDAPMKPIQLPPAGHEVQESI